MNRTELADQLVHNNLTSEHHTRHPKLGPPKKPHQFATIGVYSMHEKTKPAHGQKQCAHSIVLRASAAHVQIEATSKHHPIKALLALPITKKWPTLNVEKLNSHIPHIFMLTPACQITQTETQHTGSYHKHVPGVLL